MNSQQFLSSRPAKLSLAAALIATLLLSGCATAPQTQPEASTDTPKSATKALAAADARDYQAALDSLNQEPERAKQMLTDLAEAYPADAGILTNLALAHYQCGDHQQALEISEKAVKLNAGIAENHNLQGLIMIEQNRFGEAEQAFLAALNNNPRLALAHYNLGLLYDVYFQNITEALSHYEHYLAAHPDDANTAAWVEQLKRSLEKE